MDRSFASQLAQLCPKASKAIITGLVDNAHLLNQAGINTPIRLRHFFARVCVETGGLRSLEENLNYSAKRASEVWPSRFATSAAAKPFANAPEKLAEKVYGGRLGNFKPGDGWAYRGSGLLQSTGRENFEEVEAATGLPVTANPELLRTFPGALRAATIYWTKRNINALADKNDTTGVCKTVNGGMIGLADQRTWLAKAAKVWPDGAAISFPAAPVPQPGPPTPTQPALPRQTPSLATPLPPTAEPEVSPPSSPPSTPKSVGKPTAAVGLLATLGTATAMRWHEITTWVHSFF